MKTKFKPHNAFNDINKHQIKVDYVSHTYCLYFFAKKK